MTIQEHMDEIIEALRLQANVPEVLDRKEHYDAYGRAQAATDAALSRAEEGKPLRRLSVLLGQWQELKALALQALAAYSALQAALGDSWTSSPWRQHQEQLERALDRIRRSNLP